MSKNKIQLILIENLIMETSRILMFYIVSEMKEAAYHAWLGDFNSIREIEREKSTLAELSTCSISIGLQRAPALI